MLSFLKFHKLLLSMCLTYSLLGISHASSEISLPNDYVFHSGKDGYHTYRIPAIVKTKAGTLIAFAEGRVDNSGDHGNIDLVARRSTNGGKTWGPLIVIADDGKNQCGNPVPVIDHFTGRILLISCGSTSSEHAVMQGKASREVYVQYSSDDGKTWTHRKNITEQVKMPNWRWYATGPCSGIQIREGKYKGRIVIPANHSDEHGIYRAHCFYSDDKGETWRLGSTAGDGSNESQIAEVEPDRLVHNMRMQTNGKGFRGIRFSDNGGETWTPLEHDPALNCPVCQGSVVRDYSKKGLLFFSNPAAIPRSRKGMAIRASMDGGKTWPFKKLVYEGPSGYSDLIVMDKSKVGILFEAGQKDLAEGIAFKVFSKENLTSKGKEQTN